MIKQTAFYIPPDVAAGLVTGDLVRYGGVVRRASGEIFKHLQEIDLRKVDSKGLRIPVALRNPLVVSVVAAAVAVGGACAFIVFKQHGRTQSLLKEYREALVAYVGALQGGRLDVAIIDSLSASLTALVDGASGADEAVLDSLDQEAREIASIVVDSTSQLVRDNGLDEPTVDTSSESTRHGAVIELRRHLDVQRSLFGEAA